MSSPESPISGNTYGMATQRSELTGVRTAPVTSDRPKTKVKESEGKGLSKGARLAFAGLATLGTVETTGAIVQEQINNEPLSTATVIEDVAWPWNLGKSAIEDIAGVFRKEIPVPPTIDNSANQIIVKAGVNTVTATPEDLAKIKSNITIPENPIGKDGLPTLPNFTLLLPFVLKDGDQVNVTKQYMAPGIDRATGKAVEPAYIGNMEITVLNKGTQMTSGVIDPEMASMEVFKNPPFVTDKEYFGGVTIKVTRVDGSQYLLGYMSPNDVRGLVPLAILDNAPTYNKENKNLKGLSITEKDRLMETGINNAPILFGVSRVSGSSSLENVAFSTVNLFTSSDSKALSSPQF